MYPGFISYWKSHHSGAGPCGGAHYSYAWCGPSPGVGRRRRHGRAEGDPFRGFSGRSGFHGDFVFGAGGLGMRRPLRFLAYRLDLDDRQVSRLGRILEGVKVEREQAAVDLRRAAGELADALEESTIDEDRLRAAGERRINAGRRVQEAVARAMGELHELLDEDQREDLAGLIRTGALRL